ncbi:glycosyltransferase [Neobacillus sp. SCS-31]|uniref:glycosyltransferase n=1 Tax=Neobacillus oceani TaxID=3115292 RepID=UPI003905CF14
MINIIMRSAGDEELVRVLLIDVNFKNSSTGKIVYDLYDSLNRKGHTVAVCYGRGPIADEPGVYKFSSNLEVYAHAFLTRVTGLTGNYSYFATKKLIRFMEEFKPDVVHIHELHAYFVNYAPVINYLKEKNIKTVWTFHCEFMYTGKCGYAYDCDKWKTECGKCPRLKEYPSSMYFDFTRKMFNEKKKLFEGFDNLSIVTPSKWLADRVKASFLKDKDVHVVHNGIDTEKVFYPRTYKHLKKKHNITDEKIVLAVAPDLMSSRKGGRWVLELAEKIKNTKIKFILIGVKDLSESFGENIIALGKTNNQNELAEYYSMADVFIICSERENFPTTCIEAISCGTPVIGFDEGGTKETAPDGYGVFVPYGDINQLESKLITALADNTYFKSINECAEYGFNNYSKLVMCEKYSKIYHGNY